jgi:hypothetical protein
MKPILYMLLALTIFKVLDVMFLDDAIQGLKK